MLLYLLLNFPQEQTHISKVTNVIVSQKKSSIVHLEPSFLMKMAS